MRWIGIGLGALVAVAVLFVAAIFGVSEAGGEIVTLETVSADGQASETRLWVVDHEGHAWLRSGQPSSGWFVRLEANPEVRVTRDGKTASYRAQPVRDPAVRDRVHALMADKYGFAERLIAASRDGSQSIPVELIPR